MLYPNFRGMLFDDQPQTMKFDVTVTPPGGDFGRYRVAGTLKDEATGQVLVSRELSRRPPNFVAELEGGSMQTRPPLPGLLLAREPLEQRHVSTYPAYRVSRCPASARTSMNVSFDAKNRVLVRDVPRFVLGVYDSGSSYSDQDAFWENQLWSPTGERRMDGMNINFYLNYWYGEAPADAMKSLMDNLAQARRHVSADGQLLRQVPGRQQLPDQQLGRVRARHRRAPGPRPATTRSTSASRRSSRAPSPSTTGCAGWIPTASRS